MATLSELHARLEELRSARAKGIRRVEHSAAGGVSRSIEYRSDAELAAAIADVEQQIARASGKTVRGVYFTSSKGT